MDWNHKEVIARVLGRDQQALGAQLSNGQTDRLVKSNPLDRRVIPVDLVAAQFRWGVVSLIRIVRRRQAKIAHDSGQKFGCEHRALPKPSQDGPFCRDNLSGSRLNSGSKARVDILRNDHWLHEPAS
jgi:hypothetical protein